jgi:hypothetical protein
MSPLRKRRCDLEEVGDYIALDNPRRAVSFIVSTSATPLDETSAGTTGIAGV